MKNYALGLLLFLSAFSYAQNKTEKTAYISNSLGQDIKLNLYDNNQYELVVFYGDYEVKNDTLFFNNNYSAESDFIVAFSPEANPAIGKIRVNLKGISGYYPGIYIGTQSGKSEPDYKAISDLIGEQNFEETEANFEINRAEYIYLAREDYNGETTLYKYALPRSANEIQIEYSPNYLGKVNLQGYYNEKKELVLSENKKNPLTFVQEGQQTKVVKVKEKPIETIKKNNWTYPGKTDMYGYGAADSVAVATASNFKLVVQDNLQKALEATKKTPHKFLVVSYDPDNKNAKKTFDEFIQNQQYSIGTYTLYEYKEQDYDKYNYYLATVKDKSWAAKNKIANNPSTIVMDAYGNILSQTKGSIAENSNLFEVYSSANEELNFVKTMMELNTDINSKKAKDVEILKKMKLLSEGTAGLPIYPPPSITVGVPVEEKTVEETAVAVDTVAAYPDYYRHYETVYTKVNFDKAKLLSAWNRIVNNHAKDAKPDMDFVKVSLADIQNSGFYYKIFNEGRLFDETSFKVIDYLLKHYDVILENQNKEAEVTYSYTDVGADLNRALSANVNWGSGKKLDAQYQKKMLELYKRVSEKSGDKLMAKINYFGFLNELSETADVEKEYVGDYDAFYTALFDGKNVIEVLDELYSTRPTTDSNYGYQDWVSYKASFAHLSNQVAWFVVEKSKNAEAVRKAIKWSESSLQLEKDNPYYLDTLAQLYYKNGDKKKGIATQERALKFAADIDDSTKQEMETVLEKMKNGTY